MKDSFNPAEHLILNSPEMSYLVGNIEKWQHRIIMGSADLWEDTSPRLTWRARRVGGNFHLFRLPLMMIETNSSVCGLVDDMQTTAWFASEDEPELEKRCELCQRWSLMDELSQ